MANRSTPSFLRSALATGDLIYRAASSTWQRLAIGATNTILGVSGGIPAWGTIVSWLDAITSAPSAQGGTWYRGASDIGYLAPPTLPSLLSHTGSTANPEWKHRRVLVKDADDTLSDADTTFRDDGDLTCTLAANTVYAINVALLMLLDADSDAKVEFSFSGTVTDWSSQGFWVHDGDLLVNLDYDTTIGTDRAFTVSANRDVEVLLYCRLSVGASGGTFTLRRGRNSAAAAGDALVIRRGSQMVVETVT